MNGCYNKDGNICKRDDLLEDGITGFCQFIFSCSDCIFYKPSNADNIRTKSDEELADWIVDMKMTGCPGDMFSTAWCQDMSCKDCWLDWLKQEANDEH